ncbi:hypothetical protein DICPUDRAFT_156398 [Dictyostelium purpureum]|uniref:Uncharacterized protein n=1 Tax=Dictyostelium purpureum TaxID=5786 RepID=F0ZWG9_DICPU|nr:uncharacterized protein DICPUDRAFT_156398 [Dictyostelium purpureum]EGC31708.1 hypothetical protein DICPUDRAFT_156398 [Dictyostelium purpureum]|eukprot:XP_003291774.1 hypothetical protein DICPUDRAFT_156398 [Dictyostelium purpureum]
MSSPPNKSIEIIEDSMNIFFEESSDEEIVYSNHTYKRLDSVTENKDIKEIPVRLSQRHSLWAHLPWNAGIALSDYFDSGAVDFKNKNVLELGAGAGLPSFIAALNGAKKVLLTDYPDKDLIDNMLYNIENAVPNSISENRILGKPHLWGKEPEKLFEYLENPTTEKFDIIILSDLIFNHATQDKMLLTCANCLSDDGIIFVTFSHHRPNRMAKDLYFFELASQEPFNFTSEKFNERKMHAMFEDDLGPEEVRATVHFYLLKRKQN